MKMDNLNIEKTKRRTFTFLDFKKKLENIEKKMMRMYTLQL